MQTVTILLAIALLAVAAYGDVRRRRIPNTLTLALALLGVLRLIVAGSPLSALYTLAAAAIVLALGVILFARGVLGGGDAKLLTAAVLLVGYRAVPNLMFIMGLAGGLLALVVLAADKLAPWLRQIPLVVGLCGLPPRFVAAAQEGFERWLSYLRLPAPIAAGADPVATSPARASVPYGLAIAAAGVTVLILQFTLLW